MLEVRHESVGNYHYIEVLNEGVRLIRVAFDHEPTSEEIEQVLEDSTQQVAGGETEWRF